MKSIRFPRLQAVLFALCLLVSSVFAQSQPNQPTYPFSPALNSFPTDTTAGGFIDDPTSPRQAWHDPSAATLPATQVMNYFYWDQNAGQKVAFTRTAKQAAVANLQGTYPPYTVAPTPATVTYVVNGAVIGPLAIDPKVLITPADAGALAAQLTATLGLTFNVVDITPAHGIMNYGSDNRRWLGLQNATMIVPTDAEGLLFQENAFGTGAPGVWTADMGGNPLWRPTLAPGITPSPVPMPQRDLLANEKIVTASAGPGIYYFQVQRTDLTSTSSSTSSSTPSALEQDTNAYIHKVAAALGIQ